MICPSCGEKVTESVRHCPHCGIALNARSVRMARAINNCGWIARRALGGFFAGGIGWILAIAFSRTASFDGTKPLAFSDLLNFFPGGQALSGAIAGCFIGAVGGMIERSAYKSFLGGILG